MTDQFDWIRNKGATSSTGTGPTNDHTQGSRGTGQHIYTNIWFTAFVCPSVCFSVCLIIFLVQLSIYDLSAHLSTISVYLSTCVSFLCLSFLQSVLPDCLTCLTVHLTAQQSLCPSICFCMYVFSCPIFQPNHLCAF